MNTMKIFEDINKVNLNLLKSQQYQYSSIFKILDYKEKKLEQLKKLQEKDDIIIVNENKKYLYKHKKIII